MAKNEELIIIMQDKFVSPHLICLNEHHLKTHEISKFTLNSFKIAASYCRERVPKGGVCIMTRQNIQFASMDLSNFCRERIFKICATEVNSKKDKIIVGCIYRSPSGDTAQFMELMEDTLSFLYNRSSSIILCGDWNMNYSLETPTKKRLDIIMNAYNLVQIVNFSTRITHNSTTLIDCIYLDVMQFKKVAASQHINGLSDHDAQIITLDSTLIECQKIRPKKGASNQYTNTK